MARAVVIGAGAAGLTAAAFLARDGCEVDVFEQVPHIGGVTSTIHREGFAWDVGPFGGYCPMLGRSGAPHRTPIEGLWFIGSQSESGPGVWTQLMSSRNVCKSLSKEV